MDKSGFTLLVSVSTDSTNTTTGTGIEVRPSTTKAMVDVSDASEVKETNLILVIELLCLYLSFHRIFSF